MELAAWVELDILTEKLLIIGQLASSALLAATVGAGVVSGDRDKQYSEEFIFLIDINVLVVEVFFIFDGLLGDSIEVVDDLMVNLLVCEGWAHEE